MGEREVFLSQSSLFQGLAPSGLEAVSRAAHSRLAEAGSVFFRQGDPATLVHVLVRGNVKLTQVRPDGQEVILRVIGPGEVFGGFAALGEEVYPVAAEAAEKAEALAWDGDTMARLILQYPQIALNILRVMGGRIRELHDRLMELTTERVEQRVARALLRLVRQTGRKVEEGVLVDMPLSREDLAELAGTTLYTVSRIVSRWEREEVVNVARQRVVVRDPHRLVAIAEDLPASPPRSPGR